MALLSMSYEQWGKLAMQQHIPDVCIKSAHRWIQVKKGRKARDGSLLGEKERGIACKNHRH
jgi:hypothetical protein